MIACLGDFLNKFILALTAIAAFATAVPAAQTTEAKPLKIYVVDTEGGKADLWVTPSGETLLIDAGNPGGRDTDRILEVMKAAGVTQIDNLLLTHYHSDHVGGVQELVNRIPPIKHFFDHGPTVEDGMDGRQREMVPGFQAAYKQIYSKAQHTVLKPGDRIPLKGLDWRIVTSAGKVIRTPLAGGGKANAACEGQERKVDAHDPENSQSVGSVITFGRFRAVDLGDLTTGNEYDLMCPKNPIGVVDMYFVSNHGTENASTPEFINGIQPRVAMFQNGFRKGAAPQTMRTLYSSPRLQGVWELHWGYGAGIEYNTPGLFIANLGDPAKIADAIHPPEDAAPAAAPRGFDRKAAAHTPAYWVEITVQPDGTFTVLNTRNGFRKTYEHEAK